MTKHFHNWHPLRTLSAAAILATATGGTASAITRNASNDSTFQAATWASMDGDTINITSDIVTQYGLSLYSASVVINGNGHTVSVPVPGLDESGRFNTSPSTDPAFFSNGFYKTFVINDLTIIGGSGNGAISLYSGDNLELNNCVVTRSRAYSGGGFTVGWSSVVRLHKTEVTRNAAEYGGGFLNYGTVVMDQSTISENRSTSTNGGGGGCENQGALYINNSTFANNKSTEIGGAINNYNGTIYALNSSFTGNVAYGDFQGGAIGNNGGTVHAVSCLFAYNYKRSAGTVTAPTAYTLDDVDAYSGASDVHLYYCITHATALTGIDQVIGNKTYGGLADGSNNTIFSGGIFTRITDGTGTQIGTASVFQPFVYNNGADIVPTLQPGSFSLDSTKRGTRTGFDVVDVYNPVAGYYNTTNSTWVPLVGAAPASHQVMVDQLDSTRATQPVVGAAEGVVGSLYMLKVNSATGGTVNGGSIYGDVYPGGTGVSLAAMPTAGQVFAGWNYVTGGSGIASTANPYNFAVNSNVTLVPVFNAAGAGTYTITYIRNGADGGTAPAATTQSSSATLSNEGTLTRTGYTFNGWNTEANGSGTSYNAGSTYTGGSNVALYAQWSAVPLAITLADFSVRKESGTAVLRWEVANGTGIRYFQPERSADGKRFAAVGARVNAGASAQAYLAYDGSPLGGTSHYRIKTVHADGANSYSAARTIAFGEENAASVSIFPNPAHDMLHVVSNTAGTVRLMSTAGRVVAEQPVIASEETTIPTARLAPGLYMLHLTDAAGNTLHTTRVSVVR